jgi:antitoxin component YwqK of YwqJK toxin-antitoxin module
MQTSKIRYNEKGLIDGEYRTYFESGAIQQIYNFKDELPHGVHTEFFENGNKLGECTYDNGKREGRYSEWFPDGSLRYTVMYKDDTDVDEGIAWNEDGSVKYIIDFNEHTMTTYSHENPRTIPYNSVPWRERNEKPKKYPRPKNIPA